MYIINRLLFPAIPISEPVGTFQLTFSGCWTGLNHRVPRLSYLPDWNLAPRLRQRCGRLGRRSPQATEAGNRFVI